MSHRKSSARNVLAVVLITTVCLTLLLPVVRVQLNSLVHKSAHVQHTGKSYLLVGGQEGTWFRTNQESRLYQVYISNRSVTELTPTVEPSAIWTGAWNGSQWLISGFGAASTALNASNPFIYLYDGQHQIVAGTPLLGKQQASWSGGDIFAASYGSKKWLLSGLGFGSIGGPKYSNRMSLGTFDGYNFTDISSSIPNQWDAILYANDWNGQYWLVGGGYEGNEGVLFRYDGSRFTDLSPKLGSVIPQFDSVQAIGWNGNYWLIGGVGFLVKYDGQEFTDLNPQLNTVLNPKNALHYTECCSSVNVVKWNGLSWVVGGGAPIATTAPLSAWMVTYHDGSFDDITSKIPANIVNSARNSSILAAAYVEESWFFGGYSNGRGMLLSYSDSKVTDLSYLVEGSVSTVNWVGGGEILNQSASTGSLHAANYPSVRIPLSKCATSPYSLHKHVVLMILEMFLNSRLSEVSFC